MIDHILTVFALFIAFFLIFAVLYLISKNKTKTKPDPEKSRIYACGEDKTAEGLNIPLESFARVFVKVFRAEKLKKWHSGDINTYIAWILTGLLILLVFMVIAW